MKEIGEKLSARRQELGLSVEEVSSKTRLSIPHIKAIEAGNISYFKNDLPYLRYFLRSYCELVDLDFEELKDELQLSIDDYTTTFTLKTMKDHENIENNIKTQNHKNEEEKAKRTMPIRKKKEKRSHGRYGKIDFSLVSFLTIITIVVVSVVFVAGFYLWKNFNEPEPVEPVPPIVEKPVQRPDPGEKEEEPVKEEKKLVIEKTDLARYVIKNYDEAEEIVIHVEFVPRAWFLATKDGVDLSTPASRIYEADESIDIKLDPAKDKELKMRFGNFAGMKFSVNGEMVEIDESIKNDPNARDIYFEIGEK